MKTRIVVDSSCNIFEMDGLEISSVPMKIRTNEKEYIDVQGFDVKGMIDDLSTYRDRSMSSCPASGEWFDAYLGADQIFVFTISKNLSGSYNSACIAKDMILEEYPDAKIYVVDSRSIGGECQLIIEKIKPMILAGEAFEDIVATIEEYQKTTHLIFILQSLNNLANNGRVNRVIADLIGAFGIEMIGQPSEAGEIEMVSKKRGEKKAIKESYQIMKNDGYNGGKVRIDHTLNLKAAEMLKGLILAEYPDADVKIGENGALCSFYAEDQGLIFGYEGK